MGVPLITMRMPGRVYDRARKREVKKMFVLWPILFFERCMIYPAKNRKEHLLLTVNFSLNRTASAIMQSSYRSSRQQTIDLVRYVINLKSTTDLRESFYPVSGIFRAPDTGGNLDNHPIFRRFTLHRRTTKSSGLSGAPNFFPRTYASLYIVLATSHSSPILLSFSHSFDLSRR